MSFADLCGDSACADALLVALDGFVIPFHRIIFRIAPRDRQLAGCAFELYINSQYQHAKVYPTNASVLGYIADES